MVVTVKNFLFQCQQAMKGRTEEVRKERKTQQKRKPNRRKTKKYKLDKENQKTKKQCTELSSGLLRLLPWALSQGIGIGIRVRVGNHILPTFLNGADLAPINIQYIYIYKSRDVTCESMRFCQVTYYMIFFFSFELPPHLNLAFISNY